MRSRLDSDRRYMLGKPGRRPAASELVEVEFGEHSGWLVEDDIGMLESPPAAKGVRLIPPGDPYLLKVNRPLVAPQPELRRRLFRPVASPGAILKDGCLVGLWRVRAKRSKADIAVEKIRRFRVGDLEEEAERVAKLRGADEAALVLA
ncbi:hypothetical protein BH24ACT23_BH24ACT23_10160 [soil metagenome]